MSYLSDVFLNTAAILPHRAYRALLAIDRLTSRVPTYANRYACLCCVISMLSVRCVGCVTDRPARASAGAHT